MLLSGGEAKLEIATETPNSSPSKSKKPASRHGSSMKPSCVCLDVTPGIAQTSLLLSSQTCRDVRSNAKSLQRGQKALTRSGRTITTTSDDRGSKPEGRQRGCFCQEVKPSFTSQLIVKTQVHRCPRSRCRARRPSVKPSRFCQDVIPAIAQTSLLQTSQTCRDVRCNV